MVDTDGQEFEGNKWAILPLSDWAEQLGVTTKTVSRLIRHEPIQFTKTMVEGVPATLLRVGKKGKQSPRELANIMATLFKKHTGADKVSRVQWGMLHGLAEEWPEGYQIAIFKHMITPQGWRSFMAALSLYVHVQQEAEGNTSLFKRYYDKPTISVLRRFWQVAADAYKTDMQGKGMKHDPDYDWFIDL
ncbi:hypothetical protein [Thiosulfatihalobacter marinus]|uniref:hypothetical protein n=1 Tax=Thiosulfatihalobacter marinus TaxID=2792481 RepID=UPI0018D8F919|nr:hypothetical protein [Thiosulfatihalobacter marinus]